MEVRYRFYEIEVLNVQRQVEFLDFRITPELFILPIFFAVFYTVFFPYVDAILTAAWSKGRHCLKELKLKAENKMPIDEEEKAKLIKKIRDAEKNYVQDLESKDSECQRKISEQLLIITDLNKQVSEAAEKESKLNSNITELVDKVSERNNEMQSLMEELSTSRGAYYQMEKLREDANAEKKSLSNKIDSFYNCALNYLRINDCYAGKILKLIYDATEREDLYLSIYNIPHYEEYFTNDSNVLAELARLHSLNCVVVGWRGAKGGVTPYNENTIKDLYQHPIDIICFMETKFGQELCESLSTR